MWRSFSRSQISAFLATVVDYSILIGWVEIFHLHYPYGVALGAVGGAITNFVFNRRWSFESTEEQWHIQAVRYFFVSAGSLALNTLGVVMLTEWGRVHYLLSQVCVSLFVGVVYNYPLHRHFVYKKKDLEHDFNIHLTTP